MGLVYEIFKIAILLGFLSIGNKWSAALGGLLWFGISLLTFNTKWPGKILKIILNDYVKLITIIRLCCWIIASGGALLGLLVFTSIWKSPLDNYELYTLLIFSVCAVINTSNNIFDDKLTFSSIYEFSKGLMPNITKQSLEELMLTDPSFIKRLSQTTFISIYLPQLFQLLVTIGLIYFSMGQLHIFALEKAAVLPDIWSALRLSFSTIPLVGKPEPIFTGINWQLCSTTAAFLVFLWTAFFAVAVRTVFTDEKDIKTKPVVNEVSHIEPEPTTFTGAAIPAVEELQASKEI